MKQNKQGMIWLLISIATLLYPLAFNIVYMIFINSHPQFSAERIKEFADSYPIFGNPVSATYRSAFLLLFTVIFSIIAVNKIDGRKAYFIALPVAILSSIMLLLTLFSLM